MRDQATINAKISRGMEAYWVRVRAASAKAHPFKRRKITLRHARGLAAKVETEMKRSGK